MRFWDAQFCFLSQMKKHKRLLLFQWKYTKTPMSKFECFGHAVKGQCYRVTVRDRTCLLYTSDAADE